MKPAIQSGAISVPQQRESGLHLAWTTITYRSILMAVGVLLAAALVFLYFVFPQQSHSTIASAQNFFAGVMNKIAGSSPDKGDVSSQAQQARFTSFDGTVRVKKANSNTWVTADYSLPLEKGDVVQTMSEGIAKITFTDGSTYSLQPDSLITIEENSTNAQQQVQTSVRLLSGDFQLNSGDLPSSQQVKIDNSTTTVEKNSTLEAINDKRKGAPGVLLEKGKATFQIAGAQPTAIAPYERVSFDPLTSQVTTQREVAPPSLLAPTNMMPIFVTGHSYSVDFSWTPVDNVKQYHVFLSKNPYFTSIEKEARIGTTYWKLTGLPEGKYYWRVLSEDAGGKESIPSIANGFTIVNRGNENVSMALDLETLIQQGHVIEINGKTEPGARVMVNGEQVPVVNNDGTFTFFTQPLPTGESTVTITAQNKNGGVATKTQKVVIQ